LKCGVHSHSIITKSSSKRVGNFAFTQSQLAKATLKAKAEMQASADSNIMPSIFQLIVGSKQTYRRKPHQDLVDSSSSKTIIFETSNAFSRRLMVTFIKPNANFSLSKSSMQSAPNSLLERNDKFIVKLKSEGAQAAFQPVDCYIHGFRNILSLLQRLQNIL